MKRLQIHISTAIWLSFAAGGFMWVNFRGENYGWPCAATKTEVYYAMMTDGRCIRFQGPTYPLLAGILIDSGVVFAGLFALWWLCEYRIRCKT